MRNCKNMAQALLMNQIVTNPQAGIGIVATKIIADEIIKQSGFTIIKEIIRIALSNMIVNILESIGISIAFETVSSFVVPALGWALLIYTAYQVGKKAVDLLTILFNLVADNLAKIPNEAKSAAITKILVDEYGINDNKIVHVCKKIVGGEFRLRIKSLSGGVCDFTCIVDIFSYQIKENIIKGILKTEDKCKHGYVIKVDKLKKTEGKCKYGCVIKEEYELEKTEGKCRHGCVFIIESCGKKLSTAYAKSHVCGGYVELKEKKDGFYWYCKYHANEKERLKEIFPI